jgi:hypothetical protein
MAATPRSARPIDTSSGIKVLFPPPINPDELCTVFRDLDPNNRAEVPHHDLSLLCERLGFDADTHSKIKVLNEDSILFSTITKAVTPEAPCNNVSFLT